MHEINVTHHTLSRASDCSLSEWLDAAAERMKKSLAEANFCPNVLYPKITTLYMVGLKRTESGE